jgi:hypothetical protein
MSQNVSAAAANALDAAVHLRMRDCSPWTAKFMRRAPVFAAADATFLIRCAPFTGPTK